MIKPERLTRYADNSLGLARGELTLAGHNPRWKRVFSDEAHLIYEQLRIEGLRLYHCGSSSVPGIRSKPIIDIVGSVPSLAELDQRSGALVDIGYECKGEYGITGRRYSVLYDPAKQRAFVHLHLFERGNPELERHLLFRDHLRASERAAREYEAEKLRLISAGTPRASYSESKGSFISTLLREAESAGKEPGSVLCLLGSAPGGRNTRRFVEELFPAPRLQILTLNESELSPYRYDERYPAADSFPETVQHMIASDLVVFATPVYWYAMSGPLKNFFDRYSNLLRGQHKPLGESLYGKKVQLVSTGWDQRLPLGFEVPFTSTAIYLGMDYLGASYRSMAT